MPFCTASSSRLISTVSRTSAGLLAPSVLMRCSRPALAETTLTLIPVSFVNRLASMTSRWFVFPMLSPMNVIDLPPYFALIAAAFATFGGLIA